MQKHLETRNRKQPSKFCFRQTKKKSHDTKLPKSESGDIFQMSSQKQNRTLTDILTKFNYFPKISSHRAVYADPQSVVSPPKIPHTIITVPTVTLDDM